MNVQTSTSEFSTGDLFGNLARDMENIDRLVADGHVKNCQEILASLESVANDGMVIPCFFDKLMQNPQLIDLIGAQSFLIHETENYFMRINLWLPKPKDLGGARGQYLKYFTIDVLHNHHADFFTVGILGGGYRSLFYDAVSDLDDLNIGDTVDLRFSEEIQLKRGYSKFVPRKTSFHVQYEPEDFSISLNVIPIVERLHYADVTQYILNSESHVVTNMSSGKDVAAMLLGDHN